MKIPEWGFWTGSGKLAACDYDLGHHVDAHEKKNKNNRVMWFPDDDYSEYEHNLFDTASIVIDKILEGEFN